MASEATEAPGRSCWKQFLLGCAGEGLIMPAAGFVWAAIHSLQSILNPKP